MKKIILASLISTGFCFTAMSQSKFSIGPNAGFGDTWVSNINNAKFKLAANAGLSLVYSASEHFGIGLDAKYSYEGVKTGAGAENAIDLNYFRLPLKAIYFFNGYGKALRPKIFAGPSFGFLSTAKTNGTDLKNLFNSSDVGITAGVGLNYRLVQNTWFNADISYLHGLSDITKDPSTNHNRNLQLNVGVNFGL